MMNYELNVYWLLVVGALFVVLISSWFVVLGYGFSERLTMRSLRDSFAAFAWEDLNLGLVIKDLRLVNRHLPRRWRDVIHCGRKI